MLITLAAAGSTLRAAESEGPPAAATPAGTSARFEVLQPLVGHWLARLPDDAAGNPTRFELRVAPTENHAGLRIDYWISKGGQRTALASGLVLWHPTRREFTLVETLIDGRYLEGITVKDADAFVSEFTVTSEEGDVEVGRTRMTFAAPDVLVSESFVLKGEGWIKTFELRLERQR